MAQFTTDPLQIQRVTQRYINLGHLQFANDTGNRRCGHSCQIVCHYDGIGEEPRPLGRRSFLNDDNAAWMVRAK